MLARAAALDDAPDAGIENSRRAPEVASGKRSSENVVLACEIGRPSLRSARGSDWCGRRQGRRQTTGGDTGSRGDADEHHPDQHFLHVSPGWKSGCPSQYKRSRRFSANRTLRRRMSCSRCRRSSTHAVGLTIPRRSGKPLSRLLIYARRESRPPLAPLRGYGRASGIAGRARCRSGPERRRSGARMEPVRRARSDQSRGLCRPRRSGARACVVGARHDHRWAAAI